MKDEVGINVVDDGLCVIAFGVCRGTFGEETLLNLRPNAGPERHRKSGE